jgi:hypothetical protein
MRLCILALFIRNAQRMGRIILLYVACRALRFPRYLIKRHDFRKTKCVLLSSTTFLSDISHSTRKRNSVRYYQQMYIGRHVKYRVFRQILMKLEFSRQIFERNDQISNSIKIGPVGDELCSS